MHRLAGLILALVAGAADAAPPMRCASAGPPTYASLHECTRAMAQPLQRREALLAIDAADIEASRAAHGQMLAFIEAELGRYDEALAAYPFSPKANPPQPPPAPATHVAVAAAPAIAALASERRIVLVNEAHHDAATRQLTLELLPLLRNVGFTHFAAETLDAADRGLARRRYPTAASGGYTDEPLYAEIVREALRLGYVLVAYEAAGSGNDPQAREDGQAGNLKARVFDVDPAARLFVHAGYAHVDKSASPRLFGVDTMAVRLKALTGFDPLSIDQTLLRSWGAARESPTTTTLIDTFAPIGPSVLVERDSGMPWSAAPQWHDISVLLPRPTCDSVRPHWLRLGGARKAWTIPRRLCGSTLPCSVEARHHGEPDEAIPADRHAFVEAGRRAALYLRPGRYRVQAFDRDGAALVRPRTIHIH